MADKDSKLPDFSEITAMAGKLFTDIKNSITKIIDEYKSKHTQSNHKDESCTKETASKPKSSSAKTTAAKKPTKAKKE